MRSSVEPDGQLVSLELTDLKLDDAGQVKVVAVNSEGDASTAARLTVIGKMVCDLHKWLHVGARKAVHKKVISKTAVSRPISKTPSHQIL